MKKIPVIMSVIILTFMLIVTAWADMKRGLSFPKG